MAGRPLTADDLLNLATKEEIESRATLGDLRSVEAELHKFLTKEEAACLVNRSEFSTALGKHPTHEFLVNYVQGALPLAILVEMNRRFEAKKAFVKKTAMWIGIAVGSVAGYELVRQAIVMVFRALHG
jgi:hypothetical protein